MYEMIKMVLAVNKQKEDDSKKKSEMDASGGGWCNKMGLVEVGKDKAKEDLIRYEKKPERYDEIMI